MVIYNSCMRKQKIIWERTGVLVGRDQISTLCDLWGTKTPDEFMGKLDAMSDEELKEWIKRLKKKRRDALATYVEEEAKIYA